MSRESYMESQIPTGVESPVYLDGRQISRGLGQHLSEAYVAQGTGAGGVGFAVLNVPFEPAVIVALNPAGAAPAVHHSIFSPTPAHTTTILAAAANATPPTLTKVADNDWTITVPVGMAPDGEVLTLLVYGVRDIGGSL